MVQDTVSNGPPVEALQPAGFWIRAGAFLIDAVLLGIPQSAISALLALGLPYPLGVALAACLAALYFGLLTALCRGQTLGKMAAGIAVVRTDGSPLSVGRSLLRWLCYIPSSLPAFLGMAAAGVTREKRALHDFLAGTRVVYRGKTGRLRRAAVVSAAVVPMAFFAAGVVLVRLEPKLGRKAPLDDEEGTRLSLKSMRAALDIYRQDAAGRYPGDPRELIPKYATGLGLALTAHHPPGEVEPYSGDVCAGPDARDEEVLASRLRDTGRWGYVADPSAPCYGHVFVDCTHADSRGMPWYAY